MGEPKITGQPYIPPTDTNKVSSERRNSSPVRIVGESKANSPSRIDKPVSKNPSVLSKITQPIRTFANKLFGKTTKEEKYVIQGPVTQAKMSKEAKEIQQYESIKSREISQVFTEAGKMKTNRPQLRVAISQAEENLQRSMMKMHHVKNDKASGDPSKLIAEVEANIDALKKLIS